MSLVTTPEVISIGIGLIHTGAFLFYALVRRCAVNIEDIFALILATIGVCLGGYLLFLLFTLEPIEFGVLWDKPIPIALGAIGLMIVSGRKIWRIWESVSR